jgi:membrane peptidoglycan carboxypeptidase
MQDARDARVAMEGGAKVLLKLGRLIGSAMVAGALVAAIALPAVGGVGLTARDASNNFRNMKADLGDAAPAPEKSRVLASDGSVLATFYFHNRESVPLNQVAPVMQKAIVAIEDSRFYDHGGVDPKGVLRALITNAQSGTVREGGSTLSQQLVKNLLKEGARTRQEREAAEAPNLGRKIRELRLALELEKRMSKQQILEGYLNLAYFGLGAYGIQAASTRYFGKPASRLDLHEAATLAGLVRNPPSEIAPTATINRRNLVLDRMARLKMISKADADEAKERKLKIDGNEPEGGCELSSAPFFCAYVRAEILSNRAFGRTPVDRRQLLQRGGLTIRTTLDPVAQRGAQRGVNAFVDRRDRHVGAQAMVQPGTGKIKAIAVSKGYGPRRKRGETSINLAADEAHGGRAGLQAGSTFKAFTLATALKEGMSPNDSLNAPGAFPHVGFENCKGQNVSVPSAPPVQNASGEGKSGRYSLESGTWNSVNTFFMALERKVGLCDTVQTAKELGVKRADGTPLREYSTFTLGINEVDPVTMAAAFASFGARGKYCKPIAIESITDRNGKALRVPPQDCKEALKSDVADQVNGILSGVFTKGTMRGVGGIGRPAAGKTGTTDGSSSAWFAGYTPDLASAIALGDPEGAVQNPLRNVRVGGRFYGTVYGATISGRIWKRSMTEALVDTPKTPFRAPINTSDGQQTVPDVSGLPIDEAEEALEAAGFAVFVEADREESEEPEGTVARTEPPAGSPAAPGSRVTIRISDGSDDD